VDEKTIARFWRKINVNGPIPAHRPELGSCHVWTRALSTVGYGKFGVAKGDIRYAHRVSWALAHGEIASNLCVLHKCDNRKCVNVAHLFLGTKPVNQRDMAAKDRSAFGVRNAQARLTSWDIVEIRSAHKGGESIASIADRFSVSRSNIEHILKRRRWKRVA